MTDTRRECSCRGENPNCFRCFGRGYWEPAEGTTSGLRNQTRLPEQSPHRKFRGATRNDSALVARARAFFERAVARGFEPKWRTWEWLTEARRAPWLELARSETAAEDRRKPVECAKLPLAKADSETASDLHVTTCLAKPAGRCPKCNRLFLGLSKLDAHILAAHGRIAHEHFWKDERRRAQGRVESDDIYALAQRLTDSIDALHGPIRTGQAAGALRSDVFPAREDGGRDGSYSWGGSFRDSGEFGSYPQFDSMNDESDP